MFEMIKNHYAAVSIEMHCFGCFGLFKILCIMAKITLYSTLYMAGHTIFADAPFVDSLILTGFFELAAVMTFTAVPGVFIVVVVAFAARCVFKRRVHLVIEDDTSTGRDKCRSNGFCLFLKSIPQDGNYD
jgi:ascorbate-specific PTS system EIIC-type component UlaA